MITIDLLFFWLFRRIIMHSPWNLKLWVSSVHDLIYSSVIYLICYGGVTNFFLQTFLIYIYLYIYIYIYIACHD